MIKRLAAFDFDGTLMNSPEKEVGKIEWQDKTGQPYPHQGWWGRPESLDLDIFDIKPFPTVYNQLKKEQSTPNTFVIVLTSRQEKLRPQVQAVLDANNIHVDKLDMKYDWKDKGQKILNYIQQFPDLVEVNVYDDMEEHILAYEAIKAKLPKSITLNIYHSNQGNLALVESKLIRIIKEEIDYLGQRFLYHATYKPLLNKIKTMGLDTRKARKAWEDSIPGHVYLAKDPEVAASYAESAEEELPESWFDNIIILQIDTNKIDKSKLFADPNVKDEEYPEETLEYRGIIPWSAIVDVIEYN